MAKEDDELRHRRERGRRSQANFRKRQTQAAQHAASQKRQLKDAIEKLVNATRGDEAPELLSTIFKVAEAAGVNAKARRPVEHEAAERSVEAVVRGGQVHMGGIDGVEDLAIDVTAMGLMSEKNESMHQARLGSGLPNLPQRLTRSIWLDPLHHLRAYLPPEDIIPYLGTGSMTFAGRLFWSTMEHSQNGCKHTHPEQSVVIDRALSHSKPTQDLTVPFLQGMIAARLEYKRTGSISPEFAAAGEADLGMVICDQIEKDHHARGKNPNLWLSSLAIERRVRSMVGSASFDLLEKAARGEGEAALRGLLDRLKCRLYDSSVCFGDGPRWHVDVVDGLFLEGIRNVFMTSTF